MGTLRIWEVHVDANPHLCVQQTDLRYFDGKFDGRPMKEHWVTPPYEILGRSKEVADFTSWQIGSTFLVSDEARQVLTDLSGDDIEYLPFDRIRRRDLFAVNVLRIEDFIGRGEDGVHAGRGRTHVCRVENKFTRRTTSRVQGFAKPFDVCDESFR